MGLDYSLRNTMYHSNHYKLMKLDLPRLLMLVSKYSLRLMIIQVICINFVIAGNVNSQNLDEIKVSITLDGATITRVLQEIENKTDFEFAYTEKIKHLNQAFNLNYQHTSLRQILTDLSLQGR